METMLYELVRERNARETLPFVAIHDSNTTLLEEADSWQEKCELLERQVVTQQESLERIAAAAGNSIFNNETGENGDSDKVDKHDGKIMELHYAESAALKNERKMREELERLECQVKIQDERHIQDVKDLGDANKDRMELKELLISQERTISELKDEDERQERAIEHLTTQVSDSEQRANLAEQQCIGLKDTIRIIQEENEILKKKNIQLETRLIEEKNRLSSEVNNLNEMVEHLRKEGEMLQSLKKQEEKRRSWFGFASSGSEDAIVKITTKKTEKYPAVESSQTSKRPSIPASFEKDGRSNTDGVKGDIPVSVVVPSEPKHIIQAHRQETACVRYNAGTDVLATGGSFDGTVKIWNVSDGSMIATLRGGSSNSIVSCDITNSLVAGGGNDKTCRVWDIKTQRMVHQLVGHTNSITCVRFLGGGQGVVTASKDRQLKVWDISKQTYRQTTNLVLNSTANSVDVAKDSFTLASGHTNGSLRFWDVRTGERNAEIENVHKSAITSVQFHPMDGSKVLTNGIDSLVKIFDVRTCKVIHQFSHKDFQTSYSWSSSVFSPDGMYACSGSSSNGFIFVWNIKTGKLVRTLEGGHQNAGVCGIAWGGGGKGGYQVASADKSGKLITWS